MDETFFKKISATLILAALIILSFFIVKPILLAIIFGIILSILFAPIYDWLYCRIKIKTIPALIICLFLLLVVFTPIWILAPLLVKQSVQVYQVSQQIDYITPLKQIFPSLFPSPEFTTQVGSIIHSAVTKATNSLMNSFANVVFAIPTIFLQLIMVFFTLFFVLRDKDRIVEYLQSLLPFSKDIENKLFKSSKDIVYAVFYGQIFIGLVQGLIAGAGFFIFKVPNSLLLMLFAVIAGILPIVGPAIIYVPVVIYLFIANNNLAAIGVIIFGLMASFSDYLLRPIFLSRGAKIHPGIAIIGMIGGFLLFGILGFLLGPMILAYLLILLELYRNKKIPNIIKEC